MFTADIYTPTRVLFGAGKFNQLETTPLPGKKPLLCAGQLVQKLGILAKAVAMLRRRGLDPVIYGAFAPNPLRSSVMEASRIGRKTGCDFIIGIGGGSSIDAAKATAIVMANPGDLWDYASVGSGGRKEVAEALPVVAISTTAGTGTETDPYSVITNEDTREKLDFAMDAIFPVLSIIDPQLTLSLPRDLTIYQGFDALFHAAECYITNENENRMVNLYAGESIRTVSRWLPVVAADGGNIEARCNMMYAANILSGYTQALCSCTSQHIIAQTMGGLFQNFPHGAALISVAEAFYSKLCELRPQLLDELAVFMGETPDPAKPGFAFVRALTGLMDKTGVRTLAMSHYGARRNDLNRIADITVDVVGIGSEKYRLSKADIMNILGKSYR